MLIIINKKKSFLVQALIPEAQFFSPLKVIEYQVLYKSKTLGWIRFIKHNPIKSQKKQFKV